MADNSIDLKDVNQGILFLLVSLSGLIVSEIYSLKTSFYITAILSIISGTLLVMHRINFISKLF